MLKTNGSLIRRVFKRCIPQHQRVTKISKAIYNLITLPLDMLNRTAPIIVHNRLASKNDIEKRMIQRSNIIENIHSNLGVSLHNNPSKPSLPNQF